MYNPNFLPSQQKDRFSKLFRKLNSSYQERASNNNTQVPLSSTDNSFYADHSIGYSEQTSVKNIPTPHKSNKLIPLSDQQSVLQILFQPQTVIINRQKQLIRTQFIATSNGLRYILVISRQFYLNLSWLHSVQQLQKNKLLILYYDMYELTQQKQPKIESLIMEFQRDNQMIKMLNAVNYIHKKTHDKDVEKFYHLYC